MARRLKLLATSLLLTCFVLLAVAQVARPLRSLNFDSQSRFSLPHLSPLGRHLALEVPAGAANVQPPCDLGQTVIETDIASTFAGTPNHDYMFIPLGPFWTGRILRRTVSAEPDGH
jgi:hypothetical protein